LANPQKENGYTPIANELLDAICQYGLTQNELKVILCIMRHTYGYSRKECSLSVREIAEYTGIAYTRVYDPIQSLNVKKLLFVEKSRGHKPHKYSVNKDFETWIDFHENREILENSEIHEKREELFSKSVTPHLLIENNKSNIYIPECHGKRENNEVLPDWFEEVWKEYPSKKGKSKISKKSYKELSEAGRDQLLTAVRNYKAYCDKNQWYHPQNGSTFFNGGWKDYLTSEPSKPENEYAGMDFYEIFEAMDAAKKGDAN
jgi:phage replication O-like protein O